jgi:hypothetical protein
MRGRRDVRFGLITLGLDLTVRASNPDELRHALVELSKAAKDGVSLA